MPAECLQVADHSQTIADLVNQSVEAARDLDAARLGELVRQIQPAPTTMQGHAATCKQAQATLPTVSTSR